MNTSEPSGAKRPERLAGEIAFTLLMLAASLVLAHQAWSIAGFTSLSSAGVFPMIATTAMVVSALLIARDSLRKTAPADRSVPLKLVATIVSPRILVFAVLMVGYMLVLQPLGFIASSFLFLFAGMAFLHRGHLLLNALIAAVSVAVIFVLFRYVFVVVLPQGTVF
jgi:putative tricarboxylic transport membrane protein